MAKTCLLAFLSLILAQTVWASNEPSTDPSAPVNCSTAEGDIRALNSEKEYAQKHKLENASALVPAGALLGIVTGTEGKKLQMLSPDYEKHIDARIAEIKETCNLS